MAQSNEHDVGFSFIRDRRKIQNVKMKKEPLVKWTSIRLDEEDIV